MNAIEELAYFHQTNGRTITERRAYARTNNVGVNFIVDSSIGDYSDWFRELIGGRGKGIQELLSSEKNPLVIDLMATPGTLASLSEQLPTDVAMRGISVSMEDVEKDKINFDPRHKIDHLQADLTISSTWKEIERLADGKKAKLIMERALGGTGYLPLHAGLMGILLQRTYDLLDVGGIALIQLPIYSFPYNGNEVSVEDWVSFAKQKGLDVDINLPAGIRITKSPGGPDLIPFPKRELLRSGNRPKNYQDLEAQKVA